MFTDDEPCDLYDFEAQELHALDAYRDRLVRDYEDARAALTTLRPGMDASQRWLILDRLYLATQALEMEHTRREPLHAASLRICADIRESQVMGGAM